ncbi:alpha-ribazole phosphatase [Catenibacillus scindens]|uniref:Alpha-ribazole phosphatase n=1 Tax=Catenibacillus scindens TaxID=673271 RepID=A0A7W8HCM0_9FIRM|nr:histidine phosphatase family protein [Catenibacillus scindens]MBB5265864.1 alpha-ribazole phosphatase [Catenibacillus scindens]
MDIYLVRHGETSLNAAGAYYGAMDVELTPKGVVQAGEVGRYLRHISFDKIYISDKKRTRQTAWEILKSNDFPKDKTLCSLPDLGEMNFGHWEGLNYVQVEKAFLKDYQAWCRDWIYVPPTGGERFIDFFVRVRECFDRLLEKLEKCCARNILICGHNGTLRVILAHMCGLGPEGTWHFNFAQDAYSLVRYQWGNFTLEKINSKEVC